MEELRASQGCRVETVHFVCQILSWELSVSHTLCPNLPRLWEWQCDKFLCTGEEYGFRGVEQVVQHFITIIKSHLFSVSCLVVILCKAVTANGFHPPPPGHLCVSYFLQKFLNILDYIVGVRGRSAIDMQMMLWIYVPVVMHVTGKLGTVLVWEVLDGSIWVIFINEMQIMVKESIRLLPQLRLEIT